MWGLFRWQDLLDIVIISFVVYRLLLLLVDTRAMQLVKGIFVLGLLAAAARVFELQALSWLLGKSLTALFIAIPIVFQPELRRVLEELGRGQIWQRRQAQERAEQLADEVTRALVYLQGQKIGALLVLERATGLKDVWRSAVRRDAAISPELVVSPLWANNPHHHRAGIGNHERILAAACYLPLTENSNLSRWLGTRHRAALGVTEVSDAMSLIVSEERGEISLGIKGHLSRGLKEKQVRRLLLHYFLAREEQRGGLLEQLRRELRELWPGSGGKNEI